MAPDGSRCPETILVADEGERLVADFPRPDGATLRWERVYVREDVVNARIASLTEELGRALDAVVYEQDRVTWLCVSKDKIEGKLAELENAASPEVFNTLALQRARRDETARLVNEIGVLRTEVATLREALRKVQICCQYTGTQQILMVACDVKAIVNSALATGEAT